MLHFILLKCQHFAIINKCYSCNWLCGLLLIKLALYFKCHFPNQNRFSDGWFKITKKISFKYSFQGEKMHEKDFNTDLNAMK